MRKLHITFALVAFLSLAPQSNGNFIYHWIPRVSFTGPSSGFIEITDAAHAAGSFGIADIVDFEFIEPPFVLDPSVYSQTTWDIVRSATGTLTADKQSIQGLTLAGDYSIAPAIDSPPRQLTASFSSGSGAFTATSPFGLQGFNGTWGNVTHVATPVPESGGTAALLSLALAGMGLVARKQRRKFAEGGNCSLRA